MVNMFESNQNDLFFAIKLIIIGPLQDYARNQNSASQKTANCTEVGRGFWGFSPPCAGAPAVQHARSIDPAHIIF
jgi:hypothetical protein